MILIKNSIKVKKLVTKRTKINGISKQLQLTITTTIKLQPLTKLQLTTIKLQLTTTKLQLTTTKSKLMFNQPKFKNG